MTTQNNPNWTFSSNPLLKKPNIQMPFTQWQLDEWIKCSGDAEYFAENYIKIVNVDRGLIPFEMYDYQRNMINKFQYNRFVITKMPRQSGKSTTVTGYILWKMLFHDNQNCAILANKGRLALDLLEKIKLAYENLPLWIQQGVVIWNRGSIELENGSKCIAAATSSSAIRGGSYNLIFLDEFAFVQTNLAENFFASVYPTISSGESTQVIIVSTPFGMNHYYKMWCDAIDKKSLYVPIEVHWHETPGRDEEFKRQTIRNTSQRQWDQEFGCVGSETLITVRCEQSNVIRNLSMIELEFLLSKSQKTKYVENNHSWEELVKDRKAVVYKLTREDGLEYIGVTLNFNHRLIAHRNSPRFFNCGIINYEILYEGNYEDCLEQEEQYIQKFDTYNNGLNVTKSGKGAHTSYEKFNTLGFRFSEESRTKMSVAAKRRIAAGEHPFSKITKEENRRRGIQLGNLSKGRPGHTKFNKIMALTIKNEFQNLQLRIEDIQPFVKKSQIAIVKLDNIHELRSKNGLPINIDRIKASILAQRYNITIPHIFNILNNKILAYA